MRTLLYVSKFFCDSYPFSQLSDFYVIFYKLREIFQIKHVLYALKLFHVQIKNHSFTQHFLHAYSVTGTVQTPEIPSGEKQINIQALIELIF